MRLLRLVSALAVLSLAPLAARAQTPTVTTLAITSAGSAVTTVREETEVTLTASVFSGNAPVTRGQVNFCVPAAPPLKCTDIRLLGTAQLTSAGTAVLSFYPPAGSNTYQAEFAGTRAAAPSSASANLLVSPFDPTITTIVYPNFLGYGTYSFNVLVTGTSGTVFPTGTVSMLDQSNNDYVLLTAPLVPATSTTTGSTGTGFSNRVVSGIPGGYTAVADFNGDGKNDLAMAGTSVVLGNNDGTFTATPSLNAPGTALCVADFNGDGKPDLAVANFNVPQPGQAVNGFYVDGIVDDPAQPGLVTILLGNGDGTFAAAQALPASANPSPSFIACGDFNGDGIPDLVVTNANASVSPPIASANILLGNGDGTFTLKSSIPTGSHPVGVTVGDFNNDGILDLATVDSGDSTVTVMLGNGDGTFRALPPIPSTSGISSSPTAITSADFNSDGNLDLALVNYGSPGFDQWTLPGSILVLLGHGDGTFTPQTEMTARNHMASIAVGDFNADGKPDLVVSDYLGLAEVLSGNGDGTFGPQINLLTTDRSTFVAAADFNGDGVADVVSQAGGIETFFAEVGQQTGTASATATLGPFFVVGSGLHQTVASYSGDNNYAASTSAPQGVTAEPELTTLSLAANPAASNYQQPVTLSAVVAPITAQNHAATGSVTFTLGNTILGTSTAVGGVATFTTALLPSGVDTITATYSGDENFAPSTVTATATVNGSQSVTTLAVAPNPALVGQTITLAAAVKGVSFPQTPTGSVTFSSGSTVLAQVPLSAAGIATYSSAAFPYGSYIITAAYSGDPAFYASTSTPTTLVIGGYASTTALTAAPNPGGTGQPVALTAAVSGIGSSIIATGSVTFYDAAAVLGTVPLDPTGHATLSTSALALGANSLTAAYSGSAVFSASTSAPFSEVLQTTAFTLTLANPAITLAKYQHITTSVTLSSFGDFTDTITLACASPPANLTCRFTPTPAPLASESTAAVSLYLDTDSILGGTYTGPLQNAANSQPGSHSQPGILALALLLPFTLFATLTTRRRKPLLLLLLAIAAALPLALTGCGGSVIAPVPGVAPGTYTLTITGTGSATGITRTTQLTLTVTP